MREPASFDCAVVRIVPRIEREEFINAGVILFCRTVPYLGARVAVERTRLAALAPELDADEVARHLDLITLMCAGDPAAGPAAQWAPAARFHWLVAPRSTIIQMSPVHSGLTTDPEATLDHLFDTMVRPVHETGA
ncbi:MAG: DUF3037 domain-containing protein [Acidobacteriaceae bacterium]